MFQSAWLKLYYPAAFCAALLRAQPMGFYSPQTLVADARRHGVRIRGVDINTSGVEADLESDAGSTGGHAVRVGLGVVRGVGTETAQRIVAERDRDGPYTAIDELTRRVRLTLPQVESLASAGGLAPLEPSRRGALWSAGAAVRERPDALPGAAMLTPPLALPGMTPWELMAADVRFTGLSPDGHPVQLLRAYLDTLEVLPAAALGGVEHGTRVLVGGAITHIQRPPTARGVTFVNLEDETNMVNVIIAEGFWATCRPIVRGSNAVIVRGVVESAGGAVNLIADKIMSLTAHGPGPGRRWR